MLRNNNYYYIYCDKPGKKADMVGWPQNGKKGVHVMSLELFSIIKRKKWIKSRVFKLGPMESWGSQWFLGDLYKKERTIPPNGEDLSFIQILSITGVFYVSRFHLWFHLRGEMSWGKKPKPWILFLLLFITIIIFYDFRKKIKERKKEKAQKWGKASTLIFLTMVWGGYHHPQRQRQLF